MELESAWTFVVVLFWVWALVLAGAWFVEAEKLLERVLFEELVPNAGWLTFWSEEEELEAGWSWLWELLLTKADETLDEIELSLDELEISEEEAKLELIEEEKSWDDWDWLLIEDDCALENILLLLENDELNTELLLNDELKPKGLEVKLLVEELLLEELYEVDELSEELISEELLLEEYGG